MPAQRKASPDDIEMTSIFGAVKGSLGRLVAIGFALATLTYLALMLFAPKDPGEAELAAKFANSITETNRAALEDLRSHPDAGSKTPDDRAAPAEATATSEAQAASDPIFSNKGSLAVLVGIASLIFGTAWMVIKTSLLSARSAVASPADRAAPVAASAEPVLPAAGRPPENRVVDSIAPPVTETHTLTRMPDLAARLAARRPPQGGHRALITGESNAVDCARDAIALARMLAVQNTDVVLVNWSAVGEGIDAEAGVEPATGFTELVLAKASFDAAVRLLPQSSVHFIGCGAPIEARDKIDPDQLNLILDALDEAYDQIIVTGKHDDARLLFEAIEGRFDTGITVAEQSRRVSVLEEPAGAFLGFEVTDIDVIRYERAQAQQGFGQCNTLPPNPSASMPRRRAG